MKFVEMFLERLMFASRWLLAPMYIGLVGSLVFLLYKFGEEFLHVAGTLFAASVRDVILSVLSLVDLTLVANLMIMVIFSGYENFVSKIDTGGNEDRPEWMGKVDYSGLKLKVIGSIVAISAIEILRVFMNLKENPPAQVYLMLAIHMVFIVSGLLFAWMERTAAEAMALEKKAHPGHHGGDLPAVQKG